MTAEVSQAERQLTIHQALGAILAKLPAIGKGDKAPDAMGGYKFRGIDSVLNALNPLLSEYGVFYMPTVLERIETQRATGGGKPLFAVNLHVRYTFYGPAGDSVGCSVWGEGTDTGDKATNKALTAAMKYALFQTFAISTEEAGNLDTDRTGHDEAALTPQQERKAQWGERPLPDGWSSFEAMDTAHEELTTLVKSKPEHKLAVDHWREQHEWSFPMPMASLIALKDYIALNAQQSEFGGVDDSRQDAPAGV